MKSENDNNIAQSCTIFTPVKERLRLSGIPTIKLKPLLSNNVSNMSLPIIAYQKRNHQIWSVTAPACTNSSLKVLR